VPLVVVLSPEPELVDEPPSEPEVVVVTVVVT
jgi:hypothetical protein